jgi:hypothetical protein
VNAVLEAADRMASFIEAHAEIHEIEGDDPADCEGCQALADYRHRIETMT